MTVRIAVYSDIHGNTPGLEAVHEQIDAMGGVEREICLGDVVYGGPGTGDIVARLRDRNVVLLRGNHDEDLAGFEKVLSTLQPSHRGPATVWHEWLMSRLTPQDIACLTSAPYAHEVELPDGTECLLCHSAPGSNRVALLGPDAPESNRVAFLSSIRTEILCAGHWHTPAFVRWRGLAIACAGSVGMSPDGLSRWMLIEAGVASMRLVPRVARYDTEEFERLARACGMPRERHPGAPGSAHSDEQKAHGYDGDADDLRRVQRLLEDDDSQRRSDGH
jgi:predicted phosphodiesterase